MRIRGHLTRTEDASRLLDTLASGPGGLDPSGPLGSHRRQRAQSWIKSVPQGQL